uniref:Mitogen-activated protein kinase n=1 Tax=Chromera velia CCMP2878 TaxID=1169474 RepID=A0A0G4HPH3_9ALVE|eukprot:Cvel_7803.t1-p1 / transcript=Cvel_7803.t1 / gene=Cvel_7803 / organism=Chromera_velia_CCMP2878 / gene_product=Mitogen-activated protein kinase homolog NTF6, putative / transcript_product=Mitogen-activated protein kinase homolog NTF6, putative / location=Cvel_scaffold416:40062-46514(+) / protein_length=707 / sequence_SO=supercontig / SO=protein_coding / is_pseudo=false
MAAVAGQYGRQQAHHQKYAVSHQQNQQQQQNQYHRQMTGWNVPDRYQIDKALGSGAYGAVHQAYDSQTQRTVAIKRINKLFLDRFDAKRVLREIAILSRISHPHIVKIVDVCIPSDLERFDELFVVFELADADLAKLFRTNVFLSDIHVKSILYNLIIGVRYTHSAGIFHRDLKPANCLCYRDCTIKVADFGLARTVGTEDVSSLFLEETWGDHNLGVTTTTRDEDFERHRQQGETEGGEGRNQQGGDTHRGNRARGFFRGAFKFLRRNSGHNQGNGGSRRPGSGSGSTQDLEAASSTGHQPADGGHTSANVNALSRPQQGQAVQGGALSLHTSEQSAFMGQSQSGMIHVAQGPNDTARITAQRERRFRKAMTTRVVTRQYRAPELILLNEHYTEGVDTWSIGCIFAEMLYMLKENLPYPHLRQPLFPGACSLMSPRSRAMCMDLDIPKKDQLNLIFELIGTPGEEELEDVVEKGSSKAFVRRFGNRPPRNLRALFPGASYEALDLLARMLYFDPDRRISLDDAIEHPYLQEVRNASVETLADDRVHLPFDDWADIGEDELRYLFLKEVQLYHPELQIPGALVPVSARPESPVVPPASAVGKLSSNHGAGTGQQGVIGSSYVSTVEPLNSSSGGGPGVERGVGGLAAAASVPQSGGTDDTSGDADMIGGFGGENHVPVEQPAASAHPPFVSRGFSSTSTGAAPMELV